MINQNHLHLWAEQPPWQINTIVKPVLVVDWMWSIKKIINLHLHPYECILCFDHGLNKIL